MNRPAGGAQTATKLATVTGREALALEALHELISAFSRNESLGELAESVAYSISGQFSTANVFVCIKNPEGTAQPVYFGIGEFVTREKILPTDFNCAAAAFGRSVQSIETLLVKPEFQHFARIWQMAGIKVVGEIGHKNRIVGFIGLGDRVDHLPYKPEDINLLSAFVETISPAVSGIFLFSELAHLNSWYSGIMNSVQQGVIVIDARGKVCAVNEASRRLFIKSKPQLAHYPTLIGMHGHDLFCSGKFPGWCDVFMRARLAASQEPVTETLVARTDAGEQIFSAHISLLRGTGLNEEDLIITLLDVTEQKETERHLFDLEKIAERGVMVSSITHDLNNFLGMILGGTELLQIQLGKGDIEKVKSSLERLKGNAERMERYTASLLDYGRMDSSKSTGGMNEMISEVISFLLSSKRFAKVHVSAQLDPNVPQFEFDPDQLSQLLINLLNNAADAIAETGRTDGHITVVTSFENNKVLLRITDNGCGMSPELKEKLFRAHFTTKKTGHGYGLVTCAKIISEHRGEVHIDSVPGAGTSFIFRFPVTAD